MQKLNSKNLIYKFTLISIFAIAMAYLESAVVVYLRGLFGITSLLPSAEMIGSQDIALNLGVIVFLKMSSALKVLANANILLVEIGREVATIVMLISFAWLLGKSLKERLAIFLWTFAFWDIFYYFWLYVIIQWPPSIFTPDVLFLIPVPWIAPVIVPVGISILMIGVAVWLISRVSHEY